MKPILKTAIATGLAMSIANAQTLPGSRMGVAWGFLYGAFNVPAVKFMPQVREIGGGFTKLYLIWNQLEPKKGAYDWNAVEAFTGQLKSPEEGLISTFCSSMWATKSATTMIPASMPKNLDDYYRFTYDLVKHCKGKVKYWQNDSEASNPIYWSGTKEDFVAEFKVFSKAVHDADPHAVVVLGGFDGLFNPPGGFKFPTQDHGLEFFDYAIAQTKGLFDAFDLRLYADPYTIPYRVNHVREMMTNHGVDKPILCTEYGGPGLFEFRENLALVPLATTWSQSVQATDKDGNPTHDPHSGNQITELYGKMTTLPPQTQMFMLDCAPELEAKMRRIQARDLVMRNMFALSSGVTRTLYWSLFDEISNRDDLMTLMYGKTRLFANEGPKIGARTPLGDAFRRMTSALGDVRSVTQVAQKEPGMFVFRVESSGKTVFVVWHKGDTFSGEDKPAAPLSMPWTGKGAVATDALGAAVVVSVKDGAVSLPVGITPVFVEVRK